MWPHKFTCQYIVDLTAGNLKLELRVINFGDTNMTFTGALHTYFAVDDIDALRIQGEFKGRQYVDKTVSPPETRTEDSDELAIRGPTERVYIGGPGRVELVDGPKSVVIHSRAWEDVIIWSPHGKEEMGYRSFVCLENGCVATPVVLEPQELWSATVDISPSRDGVPAWLAGREE